MRSATRPFSPFFVAWIRNHRILSTSLSSSSQSVSSAPDTIHLTDNCVRRMKEIQSSEPEKKLLHLGVASGGCAGYSYDFKLDCTMNSDDRVFEKDGIKLAVDSVSYKFVCGATVDYEEELMRSAFVVSKNPNSSGDCSCHSSFANRNETMNRSVLTQFLV